MMLKKKVHHEEHADETWLLPYSDMLTLLLALFIVMFAMSEIDKQKFQEVSQQFNVIFSGGSGVLNNGGGAITPIQPPTGEMSNSTIEDIKMNEIKQILEKEIENEGYSDKIKINLNSEGLEVAIQDVVLFNSGDATILKEVNSLLMKISSMLYGLDNNIIIAGHSDNVPIHNAKFRSNWDLSAMRAINVMNFMVETGGIDPENCSIQAYGEYKPKYDNSTEDGRARNRRVEIFIARKYQLDPKEKGQTENKD